MGASTRENTAAEPEDTRPVVGGLTITIVEKIHQDVRAGNDQTVGQVIDDYLTDCAKHSQEVQKVEFHIAEGKWYEGLGQMYRDAARIASRVR